MPDHWFDRLSHVLAGHVSRRQAPLLVALLGGGLVLGGSGEAAEAKRKKRGKRDGKKRDKKRRKTQTPAPPLSPPPMTGLGRCAWDTSSSGFAGNRRWAQTFFPPQSGQLTAAEIGLRRNPADFDLTFEIRTVTAEGAPSNTILATEHVLDIGPTDPTGGLIRLVGPTFTPSVPLVLGTSYALVVTGPPETTYAIHANTDGDPCPDGALFRDLEADGSFFRVGGGVADLVYTLAITS